MLFLACVLGLVYSVSGQACDRNFTGSTGDITSPNFPNAYTAGEDCRYLILLNNAAGGQKIVRLTINAFNTFSVGFSRDMLNLNERAYHGDGATAHSALQNGQTYTFRTNANEFELWLDTRITNIPTQGFNIGYVVSDGDGSNTKSEDCNGVNCNNGICHSYGANGYTCICATADSGPMCELGPNTDDCPRFFNTTTGTISSTNYPFDYPDYHVCDLIITNLQPGDSVALLCDDFNTEVNYDFLAVETATNRFHGDGLADFATAMIIGETYTYTVPANSNVFRLQFTTDQDTTFRGFNLEYTITRTP